MNIWLVFIDNIYVEFKGSVYQQTVDIPKGSISAQFVADLLYLYEADFVQHLQKFRFKMFYRWITICSTIILMLYMRRKLRLKTLRMLQNGLIILTFIWSLTRMVNFTHDSYDKRDKFDVPIVIFPYLSCLPESRQGYTSQRICVLWLSYIPHSVSHMLKGLFIMQMWHMTGFQLL